MSGPSIQSLAIIMEHHRDLDKIASSSDDELPNLVNKHIDSSILYAIHKWVDIWTISASRLVSMSHSGSRIVQVARLKSEVMTLTACI